MKYQIISFAVFLLAVDSTFSLQCYECDNGEDKGLECDNPKPKTCKETSFGSACEKLQKRRQIKSLYRCGWARLLPNCEHYPDNCTVCSTDLCNEPDKKTTQKRLKCYECVANYIINDKPNPPTSTSEFKFCHQKDTNLKIRCYPGEQCVKASSDLGRRIYHGCVKDDMKNFFCNQYEFVSEFDKCTFCDKDFCNEIDEVRFNSCYKCYLGNYDEKFKDARPCSNSYGLRKTCGRGLQCATGYDKNGKKRYVDCGPISNNTDDFSKKYGLDHSELCDGNSCNHPHKKKCYDCRFGDISSVVDVDTANSTSCSQPTIKVCDKELSCLSITIKKKSKLIGAFHNCANREKFKEDCETEGIDCQFCDNNLCNKLGDYTAITTITAISATTAISPREKKCYECRFGDLSPLMTNYSINSTNCSQPTITVCGPSNSCLSLTVKRNVTLIGAFHTCTTPSYFEEDCKKKEIDCQYCDDDLCNKVENYTAIAHYRKASSAEVLKNNSVSLLNLLFIFIIIHSAL